jgi:UDP-N-acetylmuramoyl-L-alanyl-D-glutamate--2,6-diaminopimelate ligase
MNVRPPQWSRQITTVGVTGTNGKTSTTRWIAACLATLNKPVAQVTTLGSFLDDVRFETTPDFDGFLATMRAAVDRGGRFAAIEVTSEALARGFAREWPCAIGVFTNLTHDHLDTHGSPEHYLASKAQLFVNLRAGGAAVLNAADPSSELIAEIIPPGVRIIRYAVPSRGAALRSPDVWATSVQPSWAGTRIAIDSRGALAHAPKALTLHAIGDVYAENALAALAAALLAGVPPQDAARALEATPAPPGRFQVLAHDRGPRVVIDYAHTPDALARTLTTARALCEGELWVVSGAGGDRDKNKRQPMGVAASRADHVVLTSDNPRSEAPERIVEQIQSGIGPHADVRVKLDRRAAIRAAILDASDRDVVVIAGKGHEVGQIVSACVLPFDDAVEAQAAMGAKEAGLARAAPSAPSSDRG